MKLSALNNFLGLAAKDDRLSVTHIGLFTALHHLSNDKPPGDFFRISRKVLMRFSHIRSFVTYHKYIRELNEYGYIIYQPSYDYYKGSQAALLTCKNLKTIRNL